MLKILPAIALLFLLPATSALAQSCRLSKQDIEVGREVLRLTNFERRRKGRAALKMDTRVQAAAQAHACDMMRNQYFSHRSKDGAKFSDRLLRAGCQYRYAGENIARGYSNPKTVMKGWMRSRGHRKNILLRHGVDRFGIGLAKHKMAITG